MRVSHKKLIETIRRNLTEAKCPRCGDNNAYVGLSNVECPNKKCVNFSQQQHNDVHGASTQSATSAKTFIVPADWGLADRYADPDELSDANDTYTGLNFSFDPNKGLSIDATQGNLDSFLDDFTAGNKEAQWYLYKLNKWNLDDDDREYFADMLDVPVDQLDTLDVSDYGPPNLSDYGI
jgi:hypothetical protein